MHLSNSFHPAFACSHLHSPGRRRPGELGACGLDPDSPWCTRGRRSRHGLDDGASIGPHGGRNDHDLLGRGQRQLDDMEETKTQNGRGRPEKDASEFGVVRVISRPAPDAEDRLRRLFTLLLKPPAKEGEAGKDSHQDDQHNGDHPEAEA